MTYHLVFDKFPSPEGSHFIELEDSTGHSISAGEWRERKDGYVELVLPAPAGWQDIATAPRDGTEIHMAWLAVDKFGQPPRWFQTIGRWESQFESCWDDEKSGNSYRGAWTDYTVASWGYREFAELPPTHWMPLPSPPKPLSYEGEQS